MIRWEIRRLPPLEVTKLRRLPPPLEVTKLRRLPPLEVTELRRLPPLEVTELRRLPPLENDFEILNTLLFVVPPPPRHEILGTRLLVVCLSEILRKSHQVLN